MDFLSSLACMLLLLLLINKSKQSEIDCLKSIKESLQDPLNRLSSWQFHNNSRYDDAYFCSFKGVQCQGYILEANNITRLSSIDLSGMGLIGKFPHSLANCDHLIGLNLSNNHLYGSIPSNISHMMPHVASLDLSYNYFSGEIPIGIADCTNLKVLKLNNNLFTGRVPAQLKTLHRLKTFTVANNNLLSDAVPTFHLDVSRSEISANNRGPSDNPLVPSEEIIIHVGSFVSGLIAGWALFFALFVIIFIRWQEIRIPRHQWDLHKFTFKFFTRRQGITTARLQWLPSTNRIDSTMISMLEKFATRMDFSELNEATDNFSENNIISIGETGITYKGTISTIGLCLAIKNLCNSPHLQHEFESEITILGKFKHKNLVPLIGFCYEFNGRFIIYKFMPNGSLHDCLFSANILEWSVRLKIAIGIAKGVAWLHQNKVVHRGISSKCVLLDENFDPKISLFGRAISPDHYTYMGWNNGSTLNGELSVPSCYEEDVYGFGIVLLELITGTKHEDFISSFESIDGGDLLDKISELQATWDFDDKMCRLLNIAHKCVECDPGNWPSMEEVYQMLIGTTGDDSDTNNDIQFAQ